MRAAASGSHQGDAVHHVHTRSGRSHARERPERLFWNPFKQKGRIFVEFDRTALQQLCIQLKITGLNAVAQAIMLVLDDVVSDAAVGGALCFNAQTNKAWDATVRTYAARYDRMAVNVDDLAFDFVDPIADARVGVGSAALAATGGAGTSPAGSAAASAFPVASIASGGGTGSAAVANPYAADVADWWARAIAGKNISGLGWIAQLAFVGSVPQFKWSTHAKPEFITANFTVASGDRLGLRALAAKLGLRQNKATLDLLANAVLLALSDMVTRYKLGPVLCDEVVRNEKDFWYVATVKHAAKHTSMAVNVAEGTLYFCKPKAAAAAAASAATAATGTSAADASAGAAKR